MKATFTTYFFSNCRSDLRLPDIVDRVLPFEELIEEAKTPQEKIHDQWEKEFLKSEHVLNLNISISDEPGSILPWQVADLDIFN